MLSRVDKVKHKIKEYSLLVFAVIVVTFFAKTCSNEADESRFTLLPTYNYNTID